MNYNIFSEDDFNNKGGNYPMLKPGEASFVIQKAEESASKPTESKPSQPMIKLTLEVWDCEQTEGMLFDYVILNDNCKWKLVTLIKSLSVYDLFKDQITSGKFQCDSLTGQSGKCELKIEVDKFGKYEDKIAVKKYLKFVKNSTIVEEEKLDDAIPF